MHVLDVGTRALTSTGLSGRVWSYFELAGVAYAGGGDALGLPVLWRFDAGRAIPVSDLGSRYGTAVSAPTVFSRAWLWVSDELWVSDGSSAGTRRILSLAGPNESSNPDEVLPLGDRAVLRTTDPLVNNGGVPQGLWVTDGTAGGTELVVSSWGDSSSPLRNFVVGEEGLYFVDGTRLAMLTVDGRYRREERLGRYVTNGGPPVGVEVGGGLVTIGCEEAARSCGVYHVDFETGDLTLLLEEPWLSVPYDLNIRGVRLGDRVIVFTERALLATDGTVEGTEILASPSDCVADPALVVVGERVFASCRWDDSPTDWWATLGTAETTLPMEPFPVVPSFWHTAAAAGAFFVHDGSLFHTDGTLAGTNAVLVADDIGWMSTIGDSLYFLRGDDLWRSDGTASGTASLGLPTRWTRPRVVGERIVSFSYPGGVIWDPRAPAAPPESFVLPGAIREAQLLGAVGDYFLFRATGSNGVGTELLTLHVEASVGGACQATIEPTRSIAQVRARVDPSTSRTLWSVTSAIHLSSAELAEFRPEAGGLRLSVDPGSGPLEQLFLEGGGQWKTRTGSRRWSYRSGSHRVTVRARNVADGSIRFMVRARFERGRGLPELAGDRVSVRLSPVVDGEPTWCADLSAECTATHARLRCR